MAAQEFYKDVFGEYMKVNSLEFLNIGDQLINANGIWKVEGKSVIIDRDSDNEPKYSFSYVFRRERGVYK